MAEFDIGTWYEILYAGSNSSYFVWAIVCLDTAIGFYPSKATATNQQWQMIPSSAWRHSKPVYLLRNRYLGSDYYFHSFCEDPHNCSENTRPNMTHGAVGISRPEMQWRFEASRSRPQSYNINNLANGTQWTLNFDPDEIFRMRNSTNLADNSWVVLPREPIQDDSFLTFPVRFPNHAFGTPIDLVNRTVPTPTSG